MQIVALKARLTAVKSIEKIAVAMKSISAAKMKTAQLKLAKSRPYTEEISSIARDILNLSPDDISISMHNSNSNPSIKNALIILSTDRGLCGAFFTNALIKTQEILSLSSSTIDEVFISGERMYAATVDFLQKKNIQTQTNINIKIKKIHISSIVHAKEIIEMCRDYKITILYHEFISVMQRRIAIKDLQSAYSRKNSIQNQRYSRYFNNISESTTLAIDNHYMAAILYNAVLHNDASEHAARFTVMDNASSNASELGDEILLDYNNLRQAKVTMELLDVIDKG